MFIFMIGLDNGRVTLTGLGSGVCEIETFKTSIVVLRHPVSKMEVDVSSCKKPLDLRVLTGGGHVEGLSLGLTCSGKWHGCTDGDPQSLG